MITFLRTLLFLVMVPGMILFYLPFRYLTRQAKKPVKWAPGKTMAPILWFSGAGILLWSVGEFVFKGRGTPAPVDPPEELVVQGLYRYVRNPMYLGALLVLAGHYLWFQKRWLLLYMSALFSAFHSFVVFYEEPTLLHRFGSSYQRYKQDVPRWLPRIRF
jgi:protein-S-isoprenylcysteine O-methyltransferase Ste14